MQKTWKKADRRHMITTNIQSNQTEEKKKQKEEELTLK
jgi:hypothetical protein